MTDEPVPTDRLYDDGVTFSNILFDEVQQFGMSWEEIPWDEDIDIPQGMKDALTKVATQFQYGNMSHLIMCGKLVKNEAENITLDTQKLALILGAYKVEGIDIWGRYVRKMGAGEEIAPEMQRFYQHLFSEDDATSILLGMGTLAGPFAQTVYKTVQGQGDKIFNQIAENFVEQKKHEVSLTGKYLRSMVRANDTYGINHYTDVAESYREIALKILESNAAASEGIGLNQRQVKTRIIKNIDDFYDRIGIKMS